MVVNDMVLADVSSPPPHRCLVPSSTTAFPTIYRCLIPGDQGGGAGARRAREHGSYHERGRLVLTHTTMHWTNAFGSSPTQLTTLAIMVPGLGRQPRASSRPCDDVPGAAADDPDGYEHQPQDRPAKVSLGLGPDATKHGGGRSGGERMVGQASAEGRGDGFGTKSACPFRCLVSATGPNHPIH